MPAGIFPASTIASWPAPLDIRCAGSARLLERAIEHRRDGRIHRDRRLIEARLPRHLQPAACRDLVGRFRQSLHSRLAHAIGRMTHVERHDRASGHDVAGAGLDRNPSDCCHKSGCRERLPLDFGNPRGRARQRVFPHFHRCRPGVPGGAVERQVCTALAGNDIDNRERQVEILEDGPLLDVELEVTERVGRSPAHRECGWDRGRTA